MLIVQFQLNSYLIISSTQAPVVSGVFHFIPYSVLPELMEGSDVCLTKQPGKQKGGGGDAPVCVENEEISMASLRLTLKRRTGWRGLAEEDLDRLASCPSLISFVE